jgi:hypothetical protein
MPCSLVFLSFYRGCGAKKVAWKWQKMEEMGTKGTRRVLWHAKKRKSAAFATL